MPALSPQQFIKKWQASALKERSGAQEHFIDLCRLLDEPTPAEADAQGTWYTFEKEASKQDGKKGWADVYKRHHFAWEYKGKNKNLDKAFEQLQRYKLENPPLLIVSDMEIFRIYTNFTYMVQEVHQFSLEDLQEPHTRQLLKWAFSDPERLKPTKTRTAVTESVAQEFASLAQKLRENHSAPQVAHFISQLLFCLFAEDAGLFDGKRLLTEILAACEKRPQLVTGMIEDLFHKMSKGGMFGTTPIDYFNGGLFEKIAVLPLDREDIQLLLKVAHQNWKDIEPSIFGTLFERGLDPDKRSQLGAHYTDPASIMRLVEPVVLRPLKADWAETKLAIEKTLKKSKTKRIPKKARDLFHGFLDRLSQVKVLDPACGSGNFLYIVLKGLKDLEHQAILEAEQLTTGLGGQFSINTSPHNVLGIEVNPYAAELARVTIWIGHLQWTLTHGLAINRNPVLQPLNQISNRDAVITGNWTETRWPKADFIVGNPPFLGDKRMIGVMGEEYVTHLRHLYKGRIAGGADLVTYWFEKARRELEKGHTQAVGLVSTNSIRGGANRKVLERIRESGVIFEAWSDEEWVNDGAAVRVSLVCFAQQHDDIKLNDQPVNEIFADLTGSNEQVADLTLAPKLFENKGTSFIGTQKNGAFDIEGDLAREWLELPTNVNGYSNNDVLRPWANGMDITRRYSDTWIIDFGVNMSEEDASYFEQPFEHVLNEIKPKRVGKREEKANVKWWLHQRPRPDMRKALQSFSRFIITPRVSKYRLFAWMDKSILPDSATVAIARDDDTSFGILHSRFHEMWSLGLCTWLGKGNDPRYTPSTTFETFPFPEGLTPDIPATEYADNEHAQAIAAAAKKLNELRENWLNPADWVKREPEIVEGYPDRILPIDDDAAKQLKKRTLTNLYNEKPQWLINAHKKLDDAVAHAYGWPTDLTDNEILQKLLALNLERAEK
ncbi:class I SAM-dependent DNA methyltransferase [Candidatus Albibeggiatoa sp. nov. NOAA]|uniref:class I SAM-dependent DNA methyltransferase n=1 Tax=Candidatus Albibeggiatoa sp. nov. NOAA TaxID=3162724 RepID=UPI003301AD75|nr:class I SAM-dependent DNA methyltransferase [Thiotrichaceae bacterium]